MAFRLPSGSSYSVTTVHCHVLYRKLNSGIPEIFPRSWCNRSILKFNLCIKSLHLKCSFPRILFFHVTGLVSLIFWGNIVPASARVRMSEENLCPWWQYIPSVCQLHSIHRPEEWNLQSQHFENLDTSMYIVPYFCVAIIICGLRVIKLT